MLSRFLKCLWTLGLVVCPVLNLQVAAAMPVGIRHLAPAAPAQVTKVGLPDAVADRILGQAAFTTNAPGTSATALWLPAGVAIAPSGAPDAGRLFVVEYGEFDPNINQDVGNHRVLSWPSSASFVSGQAADLVIGQPDFTSRDGGLGQDQFYGPEAAAVDPSGSLWVADTLNHRVLRFDPPFSNGMDASLVLGQTDFFHNDANRGGSVTANTLYFPRGLAVDGTGALYVADDYNNRVLRFDPPFSDGMDASLVLGQEDFIHNDPNRGGLSAGQNTLNSPKGLALDGTGDLYVAEYANNRVTRFDPPFSGGMDASGVYGQPDFTSNAENRGGMPGQDTLFSPVDIAVSTGGEVLFVTDQGNARLLGYFEPLNDAPGQALADQVYGQPDFTSATPNNGGLSATSINYEPLGLAVDANGSLFHADYRNNRLLAYDPEVVGDGAPGSCTEAAIDAALVYGGSISFDCGAAQIDFNATKTISSYFTSLDGGGLVTLSGQDAYRLFVVNAGASLVLQDIVLTQGYSSGDGGAIYNSGRLVLEDSTLRDSRSDLSGGAIVNYGELSITGSLLEGNQALNGGALYPRWSGSYTTIADSSLQDNHATDTTNGWGGAMLTWDGAVVSITSSDISGNTARYGGGIYNFASSQLTLTDSSLQANSASIAGGGLYNAGAADLTSSLLDGNSGGSLGGGGLYNDNGSIFLRDTTLSGNSADGSDVSSGGGVFNQGSATLINVTLDDNSVVYLGGGFYNDGTADLTNTTLSGNSADLGGGLFNNGGTVTLTNATLSDNSATTGGGIYNLLKSYPVILKNTIIADSPTGGNCGGDSLTSDDSDKYSLSSDNTCALAGTGSRNGVDPLLSALGNYGGQTQVHMPQLGSPAIDAVVGNDAPIFDQRDLPRPQGLGYDIGAVERQPSDADLPPSLYLPVILR